MTPLQAVRAKCMWCMDNHYPWVRECDTEECTLHPYRMGRNPRKNKKNLTVKIIREHCIDCSAHDLNEVKNCDSKDSVIGILQDKCSLHPFRMGKNPVMKGRNTTALNNARWGKHRNNTLQINDSETKKKK